MSDKLKDIIKSAAKDDLVNFKKEINTEINTRVSDYLAYAKKDMAKSLFNENINMIDKMKDEEFMLYLDDMSDKDKKKYKKAIEARMKKVNL